MSDNARAPAMSKTTGKVSGQLVSHHFVAVNKMAQIGTGTTQPEIFLHATQEKHALHIYSYVIRPLAVSPLQHHESVPTPWGFFMPGRLHT